MWWAVLVGVWLLTLSTVSPPELAVAGAAALPCAVAATVGRHVVDGRWRVRLRWLRWLVLLPVAVVADTCRVLVLPLRGPAGGQGRGQLRTIPLPDTPPGDATRRALATIVVSITPGTFVVDADPDADQLVAHSLVGGPPRMDEVVRS